MNWIRTAPLSACIAALLTMVGPQAALAATVSLTTDGTIRFTARPGERNDLKLGFGRDIVSFSDTGAGVMAGQGCVAVRANVATCPNEYRPTGSAVELRLGDRDDTLEFDDCWGDRRPITVWGSRGDDRMVLGACNGLDLTAHGGAHDDYIEAWTNWGGMNRLHGDDGRDILRVTEGGNARLYGGPNHDTLSWNSSIFDSQPPTAYVQAYGDAGNDSFSPAFGSYSLETIRGGRGRDALYGGAQADEGFPFVFDFATCPECSLETVHGSRYADVIVGDERSNTIYAGGGNDTIDGRGGKDTIYAGDGDDTVTATDGMYDVIRCGAGSFDALFADRRESIGECELIRRPAL